MIIILHYFLILIGVGFLMIMSTIASTTDSWLPYAWILLYMVLMGFGIYLFNATSQIKIPNNSLVFYFDVGDDASDDEEDEEDVPTLVKNCPEHNLIEAGIIV